MNSNPCKNEILADARVDLVEKSTDKVDAFFCLKRDKRSKIEVKANKRSTTLYTADGKASILGKAFFYPRTQFFYNFLP